MWLIWPSKSDITCDIPYKHSRLYSALKCLHELKNGGSKDRRFKVQPRQRHCQQICCLGNSEVLLCNNVSSLSSVSWRAWEQKWSLTFNAAQKTEVEIQYSATRIADLILNIIQTCRSSDGVRGQQWGLQSDEKERDTNVIVRETLACPAFWVKSDLSLVEEMWKATTL